MSSTVRAQELANEANIQNTRETNQANKEIAHEANLYNRENLALQNQWNIEQWNRENEYNDPSAQMERYIKAGINPLFALGNMDSGIAQHLESGDPQPAEVARMQAPHVEPEYDPYLAQHVANINTAARDVVNALQSDFRLGLMNRDVSTRELVGASQASLNRASAVEKKATAEGKSIENQWNLATFGVRAHAESQKLANMYQQLKGFEADTELAKSKKLEINAHKELIREQTNAVIASIRQRDRQLDIMQQGVNVQSKGVDVQRSQYKLDSERFHAEVTKWNNDALLQYMYKFGREISGEMSGNVGVKGFGISGKAGIRELTPATMAKAEEAGIVFLQRYAENPTSEMAEHAQEAARIVRLIQDEKVRRQVIPVDQLFDSTNSSVLNPSDNWNQ